MKKGSLLHDHSYFKYVISGNCADGHFSVMNDGSFLYSIQGGGFTVLLNGDWRFELNVDVNSGRCINFQGMFVGNIQEKKLEIPQHANGELIFCRAERLLNGFGCHYFIIEDKAYYDSYNKILCVGNPRAKGEAIEFTKNIIAVVSNNSLTAIYAILQ